MTGHTSNEGWHLGNTAGCVQIVRFLLHSLREDYKAAPNCEYALKSSFNYTLTSAVIYDPRYHQSNFPTSTYSLQVDTYQPIYATSYNARQQIDLIGTYTSFPVDSRDSDEQSTEFVPNRA